MNIIIWIIIPLVILVWFIESLVLFKKCPDEETVRKKRLYVLLIISAVFLGLQCGLFIILFRLAFIRT